MGLIMGCSRRSGEGAAVRRGEYRDDDLSYRVGCKSSPAEEDLQGTTREPGYAVGWTEEARETGPCLFSLRQAGTWMTIRAYPRRVQSR